MMHPAQRPFHTVWGLVAAGVVLILFSGATAGRAPFPGFGDVWDDVYPTSQSLPNVVAGTGSECLLCHESLPAGNGWNAYGWAIRQETQSGTLLSDAIRAVETADSDGDPGGFANLHEIEAGTQPGWTPGPNNTIFFRDGSQTPGQLPPAGIAGVLDPVSYPTVVHNGTGVNPLILADTGGDPALSPEINSTTEPFALSLDCSTALSSGVYVVQLRSALSVTPLLTRYGELLFQGQILLRFSGIHSQGSVVIGPTQIPNDLAFLGITYFVQGFCGDLAGIGFLSNALEQRIGL